MDNFLKGKRVLFMGDSITALYMSEWGWPKYFCELLEPDFHLSVAVSGAHWCDRRINLEYDGDPVFKPKEDDVMIKNVMGNQIEKLKRQRAAGNPDYQDFDVIIMAAGTNDVRLDSIEEIDQQFFRDGEYVPLDKVNRCTWGGSVRYAVESLYELYPNAHQFICTPIQGHESMRSFKIIKQKGDILKYIAARLSVKYIDTLYCGIYGRYEIPGAKGRDLSDGLHPSVDGAKKIGFFNAMAIKSYLG